MRPIHSHTHRLEFKTFTLVTNGYEILVIISLISNNYTLASLLTHRTLVQ